MRKFVWAASAAFALSACASLPSKDNNLQGGRVNFSPVDHELPFLEGRNSEMKSIHLPSLLDPMNYSGWNGPATQSDQRAPLVTTQVQEQRETTAVANPGVATGSELTVSALVTNNTSASVLPTVCNSASSTTVLNEHIRLNCAFQGFYDPRYSGSANTPTAAARRDRIQDRIIMASNEACDQYVRHLLASQSDTSFAYGNAITATAGLGAILTPPSTTRALSGAAAIISGSRAEYNNAYFRELLAEVISRGIAIERDTVFTKMMAIREKASPPIEAYTVEMAISQAIQYDSKCSLIAGLENAQKSQNFNADPGIKRLAFLLMGTDEDANVSKLFAALALASAQDEESEEDNVAAQEDGATTPEDSDSATDETKAESLLNRDKIKELLELEGLAWQNSYTDVRSEDLLRLLTQAPPEDSQKQALNAPLQGLND
jgi:hypothetical protein